MDKEHKNEWQRAYRKVSENKHTKLYEKTPNGFLMRVYRNMKSRIFGIQKLKQHLYVGKHLLDKSDFYKWSLDNKNFNELFEIWKTSNYDRRLTPSIDRIDSSKGYELSNMQWIPFHENCRKTSRNKGKYASS